MTEVQIQNNQAVINIYQNYPDEVRRQGRRSKSSAETLLLEEKLNRKEESSAETSLQKQNKTENAETAIKNEKLVVGSRKIANS